ncbi:hypothetical protein lerEdw1_018188 [Lerista edwardsae]|nr:hypothetical protein lerEdw1_018188 [Lerista edwardsae]
MALPGPLSAAQLKRLEQHRYSATGRTLLDGLLQPYWAWLVERAPLWLAPNTITLAGFVLNLAPTLLLIAYCPTATEEVSLTRRSYLICEVQSLTNLGLFIYQSLDAIDGKQARRTNSSSPLGELFDHGCDSVSAVFVGIGACLAVRLGTNPDWLFFCTFIGMFLFYCAHWQTYVSGMLKFSKLDVTEAQISVIGLFLISAVGGTAIWDTKIPVLDLSMKMFPVAFIVFAAISSCSGYFSIIFRGGVGKNGSTIAIAHMTKSEIFLQDTAFIGPGLLFLDQYFNSFIDEYIVLWIAMVATPKQAALHNVVVVGNWEAWGQSEIISLIDLLRYSTGLCIQIADHFHIQVFKIPTHQAPEQVQKHNE